MPSRFQIPTIGLAIRRLSPELQKVLQPMRESINRLNAAGETRAVERGELAAVQAEVAALKQSVSAQIAGVATQAAVARPVAAETGGAPVLEPPVFGLLTSVDEAGSVIGRNDADFNTGAADETTWVTVYSFRLSGTGSIAVRTNAWYPLVTGPVTTHGQIRVLRNGAEVGAITDLTTTSTDQQVWTDLAVTTAEDLFDIQLKASLQASGDEPTHVSWAEVRASVSHVVWT